ncbi:MAG: TonB-dependent receptor [Caulobacter sp.]|nr:TonB-dependent receptor [Caulobacter sp.]
MILVQKAKRAATTRNALLVSTAVLMLAPTLALADAPPPAADDSTSVGEVIITAQRRAERLQDVPLAVSAFTGQQLEKMNINESEDLTKITPGLSFAQTGYTPQPTIRGVGTRGVSAGEESTVSLYIDGIYQPYMTNGSFKLNSIERIEVLKGPQSALYGRNSTGGAINVITRDPPVGFDVRAQASYGTFNESTEKLYVGGGTEKFGADISAVLWHADGYLNDIVSHTTRGDQDDATVRVKFQWRPTEDLKFTLSAAHDMTKDFTANLGRPLNGNTISARYLPAPVLPTGDYDIATGHDIPFKTITDNLALSGAYNFSGMTLNFVTSYMSTETKLFANDPSATAAPVFRSYTSARPKSLYNEVYLQSSGDHRFDWIVGGVYFKDKAPYTDYRIYTWAPASNTFTYTHHGNSVGTDSKAIYGQGNYDFTDHLSLTVGARYTDEEKWMKRVGYTTGRVSGIADINQPNLPYILPPTIFPDAEVHVKFTNFSPSASLQYKVDQNLNFYVKAGQGFKSGIFSAGSSSLVPAQPEKITQYELGMKSQPASWLRVNLAIYYSDYKGLQAVSRDPITLAPVLQNAANATIKGGELEAWIRPADHFNLHAGLALADGQYKSWPAAQVTIPQTAVDPPAATPCQIGTGALLGGNRSVFCNVSGHSLQRQPKTMLIFGGDYTWPMSTGDITLAANAQYQSSFYWEPSERLREPGRTLVDAELSWASPDHHYRVSVFGQNLTDKHYAQALSAAATSDLVTEARPRVIGVKLSYNLN